MELDRFVLSANILLIAAFITVALSKYLGLGSVLGLLVAGLIVGPHSPGPYVTARLVTNPWPAFLTGGHDDGAEIWIHKAFCEGAEYGLYFRLRQMLCGFKDQARACHPGEKSGLGPTGS